MKSVLFKFAFVLAVVCLGLGAAYYQSPTQGLSVANSLKSVEVVSLSESDQAFDLVLRNVSKKSINGYSITLKNGAARTVDLSVGEKTIASGQQFKVALPHQIETMPPIIRYVIFEDGTGEGDSVGIKELQDRRDGRGEQLKRIVPLLKKASSTADLDQLRTELKALSEERREDRSIYYLQGQRNAKEDALLSVEKLDKSNLRVGLLTLADQANKSMERLRTKQ
jgi:hypothetical protein